MKLTWTITYDVVTRESAEHGCSEETGFYVPGGRKFPLDGPDGFSEECLADSKTGAFEQKGDLSDFINCCQGLGVCHHGDADWLYNLDGEEDYATGEVTTYNVHPCPAILRHIKRINEFL